MLLLWGGGYLGCPYYSISGSVWNPSRTIDHPQACWIGFSYEIIRPTIRIRTYSVDGGDKWFEVNELKTPNNSSVIVMLPILAIHFTILDATLYTVTCVVPVSAYVINAQ